MNNFDEAQSLIDEAKGQLTVLRALYAESLNEQNVSNKLLVKIKNIMENLRSALDFSAGALFNKYGNNQPNAKIYFPYSSPPQTSQHFRTRVDQCIPGLSVNKPDIVNVLEGFQYFSSQEWKWLPEFMALNNESKHTRLSPQTRKVVKQRIISGTNENSGRLIIGEGGNVRMAGGTIRIGNAVINQQQDITVDNEAVMTGGKQEVIEWVTFHFEENDSEVIKFLEDTTNGIEKIIGILRVQ